MERLFVVYKIEGQEKKGYVEVLSSDTPDRVAGLFGVTEYEVKTLDEVTEMLSGVDSASKTVDQRVVNFINKGFLDAVVKDAKLRRESGEKLHPELSAMIEMWENQ